MSSVVRRVLFFCTRLLFASVVFILYGYLQKLYHGSGMFVSIALGIYLMKYINSMALYVMLGHLMAQVYQHEWSIFLSFLALLLMFLFSFAISSTIHDDTFVKLRPCEAEIRNILLKHNPENLFKVDSMLKKYKGRELVLLERVRSKYEGSPMSPPASTKAIFSPSSCMEYHQVYDKKDDFEIVNPLVTQIHDDHVNHTVFDDDDDENDDGGSNQYDDHYSHAEGSAQKARRLSSSSFHYDEVYQQDHLDDYPSSNNKNNKSNSHSLAAAQTAAFLASSSSTASVASSNMQFHDTPLKNRAGLLSRTNSFMSSTQTPGSSQKYAYDNVPTFSQTQASPMSSQQSVDLLNTSNNRVSRRSSYSQSHTEVPDDESVSSSRSLRSRTTTAASSSLLNSNHKRNAVTRTVSSGRSIVDQAIAEARQQEEARLLARLGPFS